MARHDRRSAGARLVIVNRFDLYVEAVPIVTFTPAVETLFTLVAGARLRSIGAQMFAKTILWFFLAVNASTADSDRLAGSLRPCMVGQRDQCTRAQHWLRSQLADGPADRDATRIADAAMRLIEASAPLPPLVDEVRAQCERSNADACRRLASVLAALFRGDDSALSRTRDVLLARATARALVELTGY